MKITLILVAVALLASILVVAAPVPEKKDLKLYLDFERFQEQIDKEGYDVPAKNLEKLRGNPRVPSSVLKPYVDVQRDLDANRKHFTPNKEIAGSGKEGLPRSLSEVDRLLDKWDAKHEIHTAHSDIREDMKYATDYDQTYAQHLSAKTKPLPNPKLRAKETKAYVNGLSEPLPTTRTFTGKLMDKINPSRTYDTERYIPGKQRYKGPPLTLRLRIKAMNAMNAIDEWRKPKTSPVVGRPGGPRLTNPRVQPSGGFASGLRSGFKSVGSILGKIRL